MAEVTKKRIAEIVARWAALDSYAQAIVEDEIDRLIEEKARADLPALVQPPRRLQS
jgi:hypothetical protein